MSIGGRPLLESLLVHSLLVGVVFFLTSALPPAPKTLRLDFVIAEKSAEPIPLAAKHAVSPPLPRTIEQTVPPPPPPSAAQSPPKVEPQRIQASRHKTLTTAAAAAPQAATDPRPGSEPVEPASSTSRLPVISRNTPATPPILNTTTRAEEEEYRRTNLKGIREAIIANISYPLQARRRGWSGKVEVAFRITPDGKVSDLRIQASSGYALLDEQALAAIRKAAPFSPPRIAASLVIPLNFQLN